MALLEDIEPPSSNQSEEVDKTKFNKTNKSLAKVADFCSKEGISKAKTKIANFFMEVKKFFLEGRLVPHIAIITLSLVVTVVNINQKIITNAFFKDIVAPGPDVQYSVTSSVDPYTPLIQNDGQIMQDTIVLASNTSGFASSFVSVTTEITERTNQNTPAAELPDNNNQTIQYVVKDGDTLSGIGMSFDVKVATIQYVNDILNVDMLQPGSTIKVPKKGYEVSATAIAKKEADRKSKLAAASRKTVTRNSSSSRSNTSAPSAIKASSGSKINGYPYGYCTYYVATRRYVPKQWGDAKMWLSSAKRAGYSTGTKPVQGAIVVTTESWWGHVAYVESTNGSTITIAEMNARGWGVVSRRTISINSHLIRGYIY